MGPGRNANFRNDPDVRLIGRSAEAWRRTAAGQWRYGTPPEGWAGSPGVDASIEHRLAALASAPDPVDAARFELGLWSPDPNPDGERVWAELRHRNARIFAERTAAADDDPATHAAALLGRRVPTAFVPAAAILIPGTHGRGTDGRRSSRAGQQTDHRRFARAGPHCNADGEMPEPLAAAFSQATREDLIEDRAPLESIDDPAALGPSSSGSAARPC
jgi:hypothetical protein